MPDWAGGRNQSSRSGRERRLKWHSGMWGMQGLPCMSVRKALLGYSIAAGGGQIYLAQAVLDKSRRREPGIAVMDWGLPGHSQYLVVAACGQYNLYETLWGQPPLCTACR